MDLRRLELAPELTREVAQAISNGQFVNFGNGDNGGAVAQGTNDVLHVVQTLLAAKVLNGDGARPAKLAPRPAKRVATTG